MSDDRSNVLELGLGRAMTTVVIFSLPLMGMSVLLLLALSSVIIGFYGAESAFGRSETLLRILAVFIGIGGTVMVPKTLLAWRQRRGARITWDDWGITGWEGDSVRTAIPWEKAQYWSSVKYMKTKGVFLEVTDDEDRRIWAFSPLPPALWPHRRRAEAKSRSKLEELAEVAKERCGNVGVLTELAVLDEHRSGRKSWLVLSAAGIGYIASFGIALGALEEPMAASTWLFIIAVIALCLRLTRPVRELLSLAKVGRRFREAIQVEAHDNVGSLVLARDEAGKELKIETEGLTLPDAALAERRGKAWLVLDRIEDQRSTDPYRGGGGPSRAQGYESAATRGVRRTRITAVWGELLARLAFALLVAIVGIGAVSLVE